MSGKGPGMEDEVRGVSGEFTHERASLRDKKIRLDASGVPRAGLWVRLCAAFWVLLGKPVAFRVWVTHIYTPKGHFVRAYAVRIGPLPKDADAAVYTSPSTALDPPDRDRWVAP